MCVQIEPQYLSQYSSGLRAGCPVFDSWQGQKIFLFSMKSRLALGPTQPPIRWILGTLSSGVKHLGHEADHLPPSSAQIKNGGAMLPLLHYVFMAYCLISYRDNFTFTVCVYRLSGLWLVCEPSGAFATLQSASVSVLERTRELQNRCSWSWMLENFMNNYQAISVFIYVGKF
jgi:hypothetical protein